MRSALCVIGRRVGSCRGSTEASPSSAASRVGSIRSGWYEMSVTGERYLRRSGRRRGIEGPFCCDAFMSVSVEHEKQQRGTV